MSRSIAVVTSSRADFGHLYWILREIDAHPELELQLIVVGPHLSPEFGLTIGEIERSGFTITDSIECLLSSDSDVGMAKTLGLATLGLADCLGRLRPDLLLVIADRYEMLAPASVALTLRIPIVHIEGGEVSEGAIDHAVRNALTMMSHVHLVPTADAAQRVQAMGEEAWRIHQTGSPSLDHLRRSDLPDASQLKSIYGFPGDQPYGIVAMHPVTLDSDTVQESQGLFAALEQLRMAVMFCFPNSDAGSRQLIERAKRYCELHPASKLFVNIPHLEFWGLLHHAAVMIGNSSSGIMESPSLGLPCVNVGRRQQGRTRAKNIIDTDSDAESVVSAIGKALSPEFRDSLSGMTNPYGDGRAAERIVAILADLPDREKILHKSSLPSGDGSYVSAARLRVHRE